MGLPPSKDDFSWEEITGPLPEREKITTALSQGHAVLADKENLIIAKKRWSWATYQGSMQHILWTEQVCLRGEADIYKSLTRCLIGLPDWAENWVRAGEPVRTHLSGMWQVWASKKEAQAEIVRYKHEDTQYYIRLCYGSAFYSGQSRDEDILLLVDY